MTAKHAPASPLPWTTNEKSYPPDHVFAGVTIVADCKWTPHVHEERMQNAAYIAHAANVYPLLVAAARGEYPGQPEYQQWAQERFADGIRATPEDYHGEMRAALLRSLGEDA